VAIGSGLAGSLGIKPETTYGTYVAPTTWYEVEKETLNRNQKSMVASGLAAGRLVDLGSRRIVTNEDGKGSFDMAVWNTSMGKLLNMIFGGTVTPVQQGATTAYLQTHDIADTLGKTCTLQAGIPDTTGGVRPYTFLGAKCTSASFDCGIDSLLKVSADWDVRQVVETQTLAAPSYSATMAPFHFGQSSISIGSAGAYIATGTTSPISGVRKVSVKINRKMAVDRFYFGNTAAATSGAILKSEPITSDQVTVSGTIDVDYVDKTNFADKFLSNAGLAMTLDFTSTALAGTGFPLRFALQMSQCYVDGETPQLSGPGLVSNGIPFVALASSDALSALRVLYMSSDSAL